MVCLRQKSVLFTLTFSSTTHTIFIGMIGDMDTWISYSKLGSRHVIMPCQVAWGWKWLPTYQWWHFMHTTWHVHIRSHSFTTIVSFTRYKDGPQSWSTINVMAHPSIQEVIHTSHHTLIVTLHYSKKRASQTFMTIVPCKGDCFLFLTLSIKKWDHHCLAQALLRIH